MAVKGLKLKIKIFTRGKTGKTGSVLKVTEAINRENLACDLLPRHVA